MTTTWLAYIPSPPRGVWHLGPLPIRAYAFFIITGIVVALLIGDRRFAARGGERGVTYDIALWIVPFGLIGGRLYHLATDWQTYWGPNGAGFGAALRIWDGGLGIWGAVALGVVGAWIGCKRHGIPVPAFIDAVAPGVVLAQAIGRLGNYFNQELYGRETTLPWGLEIFYRRDPAGFVDVHSLDGASTGQVAFVVQPTFLYELLWNLLVFGVLLFLDRRFTLGHGRLFASYVALYCVGRFGVELLRDDTATHIAGIRVNIFTSTFVFIAAVVYIILAPKGREDPATLRPDDDDDDAEAVPEFEPVAAVASAGAATVAGSTAASHDDEPDDAAETAQAADIVEPTAVTVADVAAGETAALETMQAAVLEPDVGEAEAAEAETAESEAEPAEEAEVAEPEAEALTNTLVAEPEEPEVDELAIEEAEVVEPEALAAAEESETEKPEAEASAEQSEVDEPVIEEPEVAEADEPELQAAVDAVEDADTADTHAPEAEVLTEAAEPETQEPQIDEPATESVAEAPQAAEAGEAESEPAETVEDPETEAPATEAPATEAPATEAPATEALATEALETEAPQTEEPETEVPGTAEAIDPEAEPQDAANVASEVEEPVADESEPEPTTEADEPAGQESVDDDDKAPPAAQRAPEAAGAERKRLRFRFRRQRS